MPKATPGYLREIAALTSGNREMYRNACKDAADEIERLRGDLKTAVWSDSEFCKILERDNKRLRAALQSALPFIDNSDSPGGCTGEHHETCNHCAAIKKVRDALNH